MNVNPQPLKATRTIKTFGPRHNRRIHVMEGNTVVEQYRFKRGETDEDAHKRVMNLIGQDPRCGALLETNIPFDDTLTALILDEESEKKVNRNGCNTDT